MAPALSWKQDSGQGETMIEFLKAAIEEARS